MTDLDNTEPRKCKDEDMRGMRWCPDCLMEAVLDAENVTSFADHNRCHECQGRWTRGELSWPQEDP